MNCHKFKICGKSFVDGQKHWKHEACCKQQQQHSNEHQNYDFTQGWISCGNCGTPTISQVDLNEHIHKKHQTNDSDQFRQGFNVDIAVSYLQML